MQVNFCELFNYQVQAIGIVEFFDMGFKVEVFYYLACP